MADITVVIPTYNRATIIGRSIESVLNQEDIRCNVLVVDDCSTDNTEEVVSDFNGKYPGRVRYHKCDVNKGPAAARNLGVNLADTEWVAFNDSDDVWHVDKLKKQVSYSFAHPECDLIYTGYRGYHDNGIVTTTPDRESGRKFEGSIYDSLLIQNSIGCPTILVRREKFLAVGGFDETYNCVEDWEFAIRFAANYLIGFVDEDLVDAYISNNGVSSRISDYYVSRCRIVKDNLQGLIDLKLFDEVVGDILMRAQQRGICPQVQSMLETILGG